jgi:hypothetical protein
MIRLTIYGRLRVCKRMIRLIIYLKIIRMRIYERWKIEYIEKNDKIDNI